jgi:uncharacterized protein (AIM24 family)/thioredoxin-like negative regulator of GroEL
VARGAGEPDELEGEDEELVFRLARGSELLAKGEAEPARAVLERALELRPKDVKVLGLLGQAYYRLSRFDDAARAWQWLVHESPVEPGARVNLGLALLKAKRYPEAVKQLEVVLDLAPEHRKAMGYLGLALLESGDAARAREWFVRAGSEGMVARCDQLLAGGAPAEAHEDAARTATEAAEPPPALEPLLTPPPGGYAAVRPEPGTGSPAFPAEPVAAPPPLAPLAAVAAVAAVKPGAAMLASFAAGRLVEPRAGETFATGPSVLAVSVAGEVRVRLDGLFASRGRVAVAGEMKRFRGRATENGFGEGPTRMHRASGDGTLFFRASGRRFTALDLGGEAAYFREEAVFAFEEGVTFENGRVPSQVAAELNLVHLRGRGRFLLVTTGEPVAIDVAPSAPLRLPLAALVGWTGALTPRLTGLMDEGDSAPVAVELAGAGRVLADPGAELGSAR